MGGWVGFVNWWKDCRFCLQNFVLPGTCYFRSSCLGGLLRGDRLLGCGRRCFSLRRVESGRRRLSLPGRAPCRLTAVG